MSEIPTIRIINRVTGDGYAIINLSDLLPEDVIFETGQTGEAYLAGENAEDAAQTGEGKAIADMTDAELRALIKTNTGKPAPSRITRENLIQLAEGL